jgi:hypothetical protein
MYRSKTGGTTYFSGANTKKGSSKPPPPTSPPPATKNRKWTAGRGGLGISKPTKKGDIGEAEDNDRSRSKPHKFEESKTAMWLRIQRKGSCFVAFISAEAQDNVLPYTGINTSKFEEMKHDALHPSHWQPLGEMVSIANMDGPLFIGLAAMTGKRDGERPGTAEPPTSNSTALFHHPSLQIKPGSGMMQVRNRGDDGATEAAATIESGKNEDRNRRRRKKREKSASNSNKKNSASNSGNAFDSSNIETSDADRTAEADPQVLPITISPPAEVEVGEATKGHLEAVAAVDPSTEAAATAKKGHATDNTVHNLQWEGCNLGRKAIPQFSCQQIYEWYPEKQILIEPAPEPSSVEWENMHVSASRQRSRASVMWVIVCGLLVVLFSISVMLGTKLSSMERTVENQRICDTEVLAAHFGTYDFDIQRPQTDAFNRLVTSSAAELEMEDLPFLLIPERTQYQCGGEGFRLTHIFNDQDLCLGVSTRQSCDAFCTDQSPSQDRLDVLEESTQSLPLDKQRRIQNMPQFFNKSKVILATTNFTFFEEVNAVSCCACDLGKHSTSASISSSCIQNVDGDVAQNPLETAHPFTCAAEDIFRYR